MAMSKGGEYIVSKWKKVMGVKLILLLCMCMLCACGNTESSNANETKEIAVSIVDILPQESFVEAKYYYMGELISIKDPELIAAANDVMERYVGWPYSEDEVYEGSIVYLVYSEQVVKLVFEASTITIDGKTFWIKENLSTFETILKYAAIEEYEKL